MKTKAAIWQKFLFLFFLVSTTIFSSVNAQQQQTSVESGLRPKFGIKGGLSLTNFSSNDFSDNHLKAGYHAGVFLKIPVTEGFSIQPELLYSLKGTKSIYNNFIQGSGEYRFNLGYIESPVLAVVNLTKNFSIHAGGYAAYLTNANIKDVNNNGSIQNITNFNADNFNRWDFGLAGGLGFDIENFMIGARYNYGLTNVGKSGNATGNLLGSSKNTGLSFYVGFGF